MLPARSAPRSTILIAAKVTAHQQKPQHPSTKHHLSSSSQQQQAQHARFAVADAPDTRPLVPPSFPKFWVQRCVCIISLSLTLSLRPWLSFDGTCDESILPNPLRWTEHLHLLTAAAHAIKRHLTSDSSRSRGGTRGKGDSKGGRGAMHAPSDLALGSNATLKS